MLDCRQTPSEYSVQQWEEVWSGGEGSRDPIGEEMVMQLINELRTTGKT